MKVFGIEIFKKGPPPIKWSEKNGIISFSLVADNLPVPKNGDEWIARLESKGFRVGIYAKSILRSYKFKQEQSTGYEVRVIRGTKFSNEKRSTKNINTFAYSMNLSRPDVKIACLIREQLSDKDLKAMGLKWLVVMHRCIQDSKGDYAKLHVDRDDGGKLLCANYDDRDHIWRDHKGFVYLASKIPSL